jgi:hypothetical protein
MNKVSKKNSRPLFVTRFGLSPRSAVGVQTANLLNLFEQWHHIYWRESLFAGYVRDSYCLESWAYARLTPLRASDWVAKKAEQMKWTWWSEDRITGRGEALILALRDKVSSAYFAPIEAEDARRMKHIAELLSKPFVVHLWDFLDKNMEDESTQWLIKNAVRVFCLNDAIANEVKKTRGADILQFTRSKPNHRCIYAKDGDIRIALIGDIGSYIEGVKKLVAAVDIVNKAGRSAKILYIGKSTIPKKCGMSSRDHIEATGFIRSNDEKDRLLSSCNFAFLPGPSGSPENDSRSKYSIPSRVLDFLGTGLPIVGTLHPLSATSELCRNLGVDADLYCNDSDQIARSFLALVGKDRWRMSNQRSLEGFEQIIRSHKVDLLKGALGVS